MIICGCQDEKIRILNLNNYNKQTKMDIENKNQNNVSKNTELYEII